MPNYETTMSMSCSRGRWIIGEDVTLESDKICKPVCSIECRNGGTCIKPETCICTSNYTGEYCEIPKKPECHDLIPPIPNSAIYIE